MPNFPALPSLVQRPAFTPIEQPASVLCPGGGPDRHGSTSVTVSTYEGSPNRSTLAGLDLMLSYRIRIWGTIEFGQRGRFWNAVEAGRFRFTLVAQFDSGR